MSIHDYIWLYMENEEEVEVEEARATPPPEEPYARNCFYFDICGAEPDSTFLWENHFRVHSHLQVVSP